METTVLEQQVKQIEGRKSSERRHLCLVPNCIGNSLAFHLRV